MDGGGFLGLPKFQLPAQDWSMIVRHAERFMLASDAQQKWAKVAKECVDFFEGKQWSEADLAKLKAEERPALVINKILPLVNLVVGYHLNNRTDVKYAPGNDGTGTADIARVLSHLSKQIGEVNHVPYVQTEAFMDGLVAGRGYLDLRLDFDRNLLGELKWKAQDPFSTYPDPEADEYDLNSGTHITTSRWLSLDEIENTWGKEAVRATMPLIDQTSMPALPISPYGAEEELSPERTFAAEEDMDRGWRLFGQQYSSWCDPYRKVVRMLDIQHYVRTWAWHFVDMKTGDKRRIPEAFGQDKVDRVLQWAAQNGEPLTVMNLRTRRLRWTQMVGHVVVGDQWSPYDTFTLIPFFPYFRRGKSRSFVEPLLDPQREINVRRSARINIIGRSSNGGWMYPEGSLTPQQEDNLKRNGGKPGFTLKYKPVDAGQQALAAPSQINPAQAPVSIEQLEKEAENDIKQIAGVNDSALGLVDATIASGRAIRARQQGTVIGLEGTMNNWHRTMELAGEKQLEIIQQHYTEERVIRATGEGPNPVAIVINQASARGIVNDVTLGTYKVDIGETTLTEDFLAAQFNELLELKSIGLPIPDDFLIDASSVGRKEELRAALEQARQAQAAMGAAPGVSPPAGGGVSPPGGSRKAPGGAEPGGPPQNDATLTGP